MFIATEAPDLGKPPRPLPAREGTMSRPPWGEVPDARTRPPKTRGVLAGSKGSRNPRLGNTLKKEP